MDSSEAVLAALGTILKFAFRVSLGAVCLLGLWSLIVASFATVPPLGFWACASVTGLIEYARLLMKAN